ncbi:MAG: hypothetical protein ACTSXL_02445 [Alphaproteobacteria bacterium]
MNLMENLEYKIGGLKIVPEKIKFTGNDPYDAEHLFVVQNVFDSVLIYVAPAKSHQSAAGNFGIYGSIMGGGSFYTNEKNELVVGDYSGTYDAISNDAAQKFAELIIPKLDELGVTVDGIKVNPNQLHLNSFWRDK